MAGRAAGTSAWATNVGNEIGQVLMCVTTSGEGKALKAMADGLVGRYRQAHVTPPLLLYTDRDCCGGGQIGSVLFPDWSQMQVTIAQRYTTLVLLCFGFNCTLHMQLIAHMNSQVLISNYCLLALTTLSSWLMHILLFLQVRLDVWHFMRRLADCCNTQSHLLYPDFMDRLSPCVYEWDKDDVARLKDAKKREMEKGGIGNATEQMVMSALELALHCRRRTCGVEATK